MPLLPEIVLACGAMVMLMVGVIGGERSAPAVNGWCIGVLVLVAGAIIAWVPAGRFVLFGGSFVVDDFARFLKLLTLIGSAGALMLSLDYLTPKAAEIRIRRAVPALDARHADADLGRRPDRALSRARADEPVALRDRGLEPRQCALDRSRPEIFRARRAVVRHAALRRLADLRLHRHGEFRRHRQGGGAEREISA